jgi:SNF2 family DNA or RNA helicase
MADTPRTWRPKKHQEKALAFGCYRLVERPLAGHPVEGVGYFMEPGLGKTTTTLELFRILRGLRLAKRAVILAPTRVCSSVWRQEAEQWSQFCGFRFENLAGRTKIEREAALRRYADFYMTNPEGTDWLMTELATTGRFADIDTLIIDESTRFKGPSSKCVKAVVNVLPRFRNRIILTGTPMPNSVEDLWSQVSILDDGRRLGSRITSFRNVFMTLVNRGSFMQSVARKGAVESVKQAISDICLYLSADDYLDMPDLIENDIYVDLSPKLLRDYKELEQTLVATLQTLTGEEASFEAMSAAAVYGYCRQMANGGIYLPTNDQFELAIQRSSLARVVAHTHLEKAQVVKELQDELNGRPMLIFINYRHDYDRICQVLGKKPPVIWGGTSSAETDRLVQKWNANELPVLVGHPASMGHGLNMQKGDCRDVVWFGLPDKPELYIQGNARIYRQGVGGSVRVHKIHARDTVDKAVAARLTDKDLAQKSLLAYLKESYCGS